MPETLPCRNLSILRNALQNVRSFGQTSLAVLKGLAREQGVKTMLFAGAFFAVLFLAYGARNIAIGGFRSSLIFLSTIPLILSILNQKRRGLSTAFQDDESYNRFENIAEALNES